MIAVAAVLPVLREDVPALPVEVPGPLAEQLRRLRDARDWPGLDRACAVTYRRGYSQAAIGRVLGVGREVIRRRVDRVPESVVARVRRDAATLPPANPYGKGRRKAQSVPDADRRRMVELLPLAARRRGAHQPGHPIRDASDELDAIMARLYFDGNVASAAIADAVGVAVRGVEKRAHRGQLVRRARRRPVKPTAPAA